MAKILKLWFNGVIKGWVQVSQPPALRLSYSGGFTSLSTPVKDAGLENKIYGNKNKANKHKKKKKKIPETNFLEKSHVFNTKNVPVIPVLCLHVFEMKILRCHTEKVTA